MLSVLKNKVQRIVPLLGLDDITGSNGLGIRTPSAVRKIGDAHIKLARGYLGDPSVYKDILPSPPNQPPPDTADGAQPVNAKSFGNTSYSENSLYKEGMVPGSIDAQSYRK